MITKKNRSKATKPEFSIIIPVRTITPYLRQTLDILQSQIFRRFEIIVITDKPENYKGVKIVASKEPGPAYKRNLAAKIAKGRYLAFLDDDSYPSEEWLNNAKSVFEQNNTISGACGPTLTPPEDNVYQKASGWVSALWLGSGGAGVYRNRIMGRRIVDDYPSVNLIIKKQIFQAVGGFDPDHWPGEDTKLCLDITRSGGKILYDPSIVVFHHRRAIFLPHLKQISRYAMRRGFFAKKFPQTSFRLGYFIPTLFTVWLLFVPLIAVFIKVLFKFDINYLWRLYEFSLFLYIGLLMASGIEVFIKEKNIFLASLVMLSIISTHLYYGILFPVGYFQKDMGVVPHAVDWKRKTFIGG